MITIDDIVRNYRSSRIPGLNRVFDLELESREPPIDFYQFIIESWPFVDSEKYVDNWHVKEIADVLDGMAKSLFYDRSGSELVISVPPGSSKSIISSVMWQPWVWSWWPESRWITATYESGLAGMQSAKSRDLVKSDWYQSRWPVVIVKDAEKYWSNNRSGFRVASGTGGAVTGKHGHFHLGDDLVKEQDSRQGSPQVIAGAMERANSFWFGTMATRGLGSATAKVLIGQRLHPKDPPGKAVKRGYDAMIFPAHFDPAKADPRDHRTQDGELICESFRDDKYWDDLALTLGPTAASAQLEQDPMPPGGNILKPRYFEARWSELPSELKRAIADSKALSGQDWITAWDLTFKGKTTSDFVVGQVWVRFRGDHYLIDQVRGQMGFRDSKQAFCQLIGKYPWITKHIVEDAANAAALEDDLKVSIPGIVLEPHGGGCLARTQKVEGVWASGSVIIPEKATWVTEVGGFIDEHTTFSGSPADTDDQVAASSLALVWYSAKGSLPFWAQLEKRR